MPNLMLCGVRPVTLSRCLVANARTTSLRTFRPRVARNSISNLWCHQSRNGLQGTYITREWALDPRRHSQQDGLTASPRWNTSNVGAFKSSQLRALSAKPRDDLDPAPPTKILSNALNPRHEDIYTLPNILTVTRIFCAPAIGYLLLHDQYPWALGLFVYAGVTDLVDGWIARRWSMQTVVGTVLDPMADKALMTVVVVVLGWQGWVPAPLAIVVLGRDVLLSLTAFYYRYISLPPPRTFARYWDFSLPSAEVKPTSISKVNTFLQLGLLGVTMTGLAFPSVMGETAQSALEVSWWIVGGTTIWSGLSYLGRGGVRILGKKG